MEHWCWISFIFEQLTRQPSCSFKEIYITFIKIVSSKVRISESVQVHFMVSKYVLSFKILGISCVSEWGCKEMIAQVKGEMMHSSNFKIQSMHPDICCLFWCPLYYPVSGPPFEICCLKCEKLRTVLKVCIALRKAFWVGFGTFFEEVWFFLISKKLNTK